MGATLASWVLGSIVAAAALVTALGADVANAPQLQWTVEALPSDANAGDEVELHFVASLPPHLIVYSSDFAAQLGPRPARLTLEQNDAIALAGPLQAVGSKRRTDKTFGTEYSYFAGRAEFRQRARLLADSAQLKGSIVGQTCDERDGVCTLFREPFALELR
jgi:thiol:disulfide interchange protein DsbD